MKKTTDKVLALILGTAMLAGPLTGCGNSDNSSTSGSSGTAEESTADSTASDVSGSTAQEGTAAADTSEHADLTMYLIGDTNADFDQVVAKMNEILEEKLNCSLTINILSWGEQETKYSMLFSAQEDFDLIFTAAQWAYYEQTVSLGGFYPLSDEFIQTYAPDIWNTLPANAWEQAEIDGQVYMVPNYKVEYAKDSWVVRGDLLDKYGISEITTWDELKNFYMACADDGIYANRQSPWYSFCGYNGMNTTDGTPDNGELVLYHAQDPADLDFYYLLDWDGFADYCKQAKEMANAGCWPADTLNSDEEQITGMLANRTAIIRGTVIGNLAYAKQVNSEHPEWNVTLLDPVPSIGATIYPYTNNGMAININSKNKERAMMVLNELYTNPELYDLYMLGIEGVHWEAVGDDQYTLIEGTGRFIDNNCGWTNYAIQRTEYIPDRNALDDVYDELINEWDNNVKADHPYDNFKFVSTNVSTQYAAVEAAIGTYFDPLICGLVDDVDATIEEFRSAMENAGIRDVLAEMERQVSEYIANK